VLLCETVGGDPLDHLGFGQLSRIRLAVPPAHLGDRPTDGDTAASWRVLADGHSQEYLHLGTARVRVFGQLSVEARQVGVGDRRRLRWTGVLRGRPGRLAGRYREQLPGALAARQLQSAAARLYFEKRADRREALAERLANLRRLPKLDMQATRLRSLIGCFADLDTGAHRGDDSLPVPVDPRPRWASASGAGPLGNGRGSGQVCVGRLASPYRRPNLSRR